MDQITVQKLEGVHIRQKMQIHHFKLQAKESKRVVFVIVSRSSQNIRKCNGILCRSCVCDSFTLLSHVTTCLLGSLDIH